MTEDTANLKIRLGISACLLGQEVRFDGGHTHDRFITETLGQYVEFVPVCPEVESGLGISRGAMRLVGEIDQPRLVTIWGTVGGFALIALAVAFWPGMPQVGMLTQQRRRQAFPRLRRLRRRLTNVLEAGSHPARDPDGTFDSGSNKKQGDT